LNKPEEFDGFEKIPAVAVIGFRLGPEKLEMRDDKNLLRTSQLNITANSEVNFFGAKFEVRRMKKNSTVLSQEIYCFAFKTQT